MMNLDGTTVALQAVKDSTTLILEFSKGQLIEDSHVTVPSRSVRIRPRSAAAAARSSH